MNRPTMLAAVSGILDYIRHDKNSDMFADHSERINAFLIPMVDWPLATKLALERRVLGTWVSGHPLDLVKGKYEHRIKYKLRDIDDLLPVASSNETFNFAFIVTEVFVRGKIVRVTGDDETARVQLSCWRKDSDPFWHLLKKDQIVIAQCSPHHNGRYSEMQLKRMHRLGELPALPAKQSDLLTKERAASSAAQD